MAVGRSGLVEHAQHTGPEVMLWKRNLVYKMPSTDESCVPIIWLYYIKIS